MAKILCESCGKKLEHVHKQEQNGIWIYGVCSCSYQRNIRAEVISNDKAKAFSRTKLGEFIDTYPTRFTAEYRKPFNKLELKEVMQTDDEEIASQVIEEFVESKRLVNPDKQLETLFVVV